MTSVCTALDTCGPAGPLGVVFAGTVVAIFLWTQLSQYLRRDQIAEERAKAETAYRAREARLLERDRKEKARQDAELELYFKEYDEREARRQREYEEMLRGLPR